MRADLKVIGPAANFGQLVASGGTAIQVGEPVHRVGHSYSSGAVSVNTYVLAAADTPVIGTHDFGGIANENSKNVAAGTTERQKLLCSLPVPSVGRIRGRAETTASIDTDSEIDAITGDAVLIDYNATGASDSGELYTIKEVASADTSGLTIVGADKFKYLIDVTVQSRAYRNDIS